MASTQVEAERIRVLREPDDDQASDGRYVLYWMQSSMRAVHNPALEVAVQRANEHDLPVVVLATIIADYPDNNRRHMAFMLGGMATALRAVERRGARVCVRIGDPVEIVRALAADAAELVLDRGYLRHQRDWYDELTSSVACGIRQVEGDVVVPVDVVSDKRETAARTIRPKINGERDRFVRELATTAIDDTTTPEGTTSDVSLDELDEVTPVLDRLELDGEPEPVDWITPGTDAADHALSDFLDAIEDYDDRRNRYNDAAGTSRLSPYLHFGHISPVAVALEVIDRAGDGAEDFLEELVVRRELAVNFVLHEPDYDSYRSLPEWARDSLDAHADDEREHVYTASELEQGETHDEVWNAIMHEIRERGWVHNQLRMYWGKQFVRWTNTPQHAHRTLLDINNRWFLDGRDANSYANVGWCFGIHDQGFKERDVTGKLRPFTTAALKRKDDLQRWVDEHDPADDG